MPQRGKNHDPRYTSLGVRIPKDLKRRLTVKLAYYDDLNTSTAVEALLELWVNGAVEIGTPADAPQDVYKPENVTTISQQNSQTHKPTPATEDATAIEFDAIRQQLGLSQRAYADALGIHHSSVGKYRKQGCPEDVLERARALLSGDSDNEG